MKKIFFAVALMFATVVSAKAGDRERPITVEQLPAAAQQFLAANFKDLTIAFVVEDPKFVGSEYEVTYTDRTEIDFDTQGQWTSIERKYSALPASLIPQQIAGRDVCQRFNFTQCCRHGSFAGTRRPKENEISFADRHSYVSP